MTRPSNHFKFKRTLPGQRIGPIVRERLLEYLPFGTIASNQLPQEHTHLAFLVGIQQHD